MILSFTLDGKNYAIDQSASIDISIPLLFNGDQPNVFGVAPANSNACETKDLIGDTRRGGSCNFEQYTLIPHCNGTHTECVGHITHERISVCDILRDTLVPATLISIQPESALKTADSYVVKLSDNDQLITKSALELALSSAQGNLLAGLIVRTSPNDDEKLSQRYSSAPFFSLEAMRFIVSLGVKHLVVDLPSIDRLSDDGKLANHRLFWNVADGRFEVKEGSRRDSTITELVYVRNEIPDGRYILNIQIAAFASDASPSRPLLFPFISI